MAHLITLDRTYCIVCGSFTRMGLYVADVVNFRLGHSYSRTQTPICESCVAIAQNIAQHIEVDPEPKSKALASLRVSLTAVKVLAAQPYPIFQQIYSAFHLGSRDTDLLQWFNPAPPLKSKKKRRRRK